MASKPLPPHLRKPHLRPVLPRSEMRDGRPYVALGDPAKLRPDTLVVASAAQSALNLFKGELTVEQVAQQLHHPVAQIEDFVRRLDEFGLVYGPTYERLARNVAKDLCARGSIAVQAAGALGRDAEACHSAIVGRLDDSGATDHVRRSIGIVAPHQPYKSSWPGYASAYDGFLGVERPDRVVLLGSDHVGRGGRVTLCRHAFETLMGSTPVDKAVVGKLLDALGDALLVDEVQLLYEHSLLVQIPWIQHFFGQTPIVAAIMPDPLKPVASGPKPVTASDFVGRLRQILADLGGSTRFIASADLSHVGVRQGEMQLIDANRCAEVERHDRRLLATYLKSDGGAFLTAMKETHNSTNWCSIGAMLGILELARPSSLELVHYRQFCDGDAFNLTTMASIAMLEN